MWTPTELASEFRHYRRTVWRVVEAQHRISTNRLATTLADQERLEELAEAAKPNLPTAAQGLHFLLASPFRYGHTVASRFRRADERFGIFYSSESEKTAVVETAYWRLRFFSRSPGFLPGNRISEHLSFSVPLLVSRMLDLTRPPLARDRAKWIGPIDYSACQDLAASARAASGQAIRTLSARDPDAVNIALFDPACFAKPVPDHGRNWHLRLEGGRLSAMAAFPSETVLQFTPHEFGLEGLA
jgi:RES domain